MAKLYGCHISMALDEEDQVGVHNRNQGGRASLHGKASEARSKVGATFRKKVPATDWPAPWSDARRGLYRRICYQASSKADSDRSTQRSESSRGSRTCTQLFQRATTSTRRDSVSGTSDEVDVGEFVISIGPGGGAAACLGSVCAESGAQRKWPHPRGDSGEAVGSRRTMRALWLSADGQNTEVARPRNCQYPPLQPLGGAFFVSVSRRGGG